MIGANVGTPDNDETTRSQPLAPARRKARRRRGRPRTGNGRRLFAFDREIGCRFVAGADEAGRGSLAGPLVAAAVLFDLERLTLSDRRALTRLNDSKQHTAEAREELYPLVMRAAARSVIVSRCVRGIDSRGLAQDQPRGPPDGAARRGAAGRRLPRRRLQGARVRLRAASRDRRRLPKRRDRGRIRAGKGEPRPLHAPRRRAPPGLGLRDQRRLLHPGAPSRDRANGVSPLHRMSFQSIAYTQLALEG